MPSGPPEDRAPRFRPIRGRPRSRSDNRNWRRHSPRRGFPRQAGTGWAPRPESRCTRRRDTPCRHGEPRASSERRSGRRARRRRAESSPEPPCRHRRRDWRTEPRRAPLRAARAFRRIPRAEGARAAPGGECASRLWSAHRGRRSCASAAGAAARRAFRKSCRFLPVFVSACGEGEGAAWADGRAWRASLR